MARRKYLNVKKISKNVLLMADELDKILDTKGRIKIKDYVKVVLGLDLRTQKAKEKI